MSSSPPSSPLFGDPFLVALSFLVVGLGGGHSAVIVTQHSDDHREGRINVKSYCSAWDGECA